MIGKPTKLYACLGKSLEDTIKTLGWIESALLTPRFLIPECLTKARLVSKRRLIWSGLKIYLRRKQPGPHTIGLPHSRCEPCRSRQPRRSLSQQSHNCSRVHT